VKISYDPAADALYISLEDVASDHRVVRLTPDVAVDYGADDEVVGVEVLNARRVLGGGGTPVVELQNLIGRATGR
jgi:uncharacterized protein YuzE